MKKKLILLGTIAYVAATFPWAIIWHIVLFKPIYESLNYFGGEPNFLLGFLSILLQGFILSYGFPMTKFSGSPVVCGMKYAAFMGVFFWTCHVIAAAAKNPLSNSALYFFMETFYLCIQFGIYGYFIGKIYSKSPAE